MSSEKSAQISAKVIAHSKSSISGKELITFELEFPRIILAEWNTHNAISKNASSSRAIPVNKMIEQVRSNPAYPVRFGKANKGMQDAGEHHQGIEYAGVELTPKEFWWQCAQDAADLAERWYEEDYAKQICNRIIEPYQLMKVVATATEWDNLFWLRKHKAADPTIEALTNEIYKIKKASTPVVLKPGEWHVPYYQNGVWKPVVKLTYGEKPLVDYDEFGNTLEHALTISASCCAQVSFRDIDNSVEKAERVSRNLNLKGEVKGEPVHASPTEHQGTPVDVGYINDPSDYSDGHNQIYICTWQEGITHIDRKGQFCSGNLKGFIQYRQLIPNNVCTDYKEQGEPNHV